jgi:hypothetical protein
MAAFVFRLAAHLRIVLSQIPGLLILCSQMYSNIFYQEGGILKSNLIEIPGQQASRDRATHSFKYLKNVPAEMSATDCFFANRTRQHTCGKTIDIVNE